MKNFFKSLFAIALPWLVILLDDNPGGAILALILQVTIIGWIPAAMWALRVIHQDSEKGKSKTNTGKA